MIPSGKKGRGMELIARKQLQNRARHIRHTRRAVEVLCLLCGPCLAQKFASLEPSVLSPRDGQTAGSREAGVSEDQASAVSMRRIDKRAAKKKDKESLIHGIDQSSYLEFCCS